jgi:hypothetical protein
VTADSERLDEFASDLRNAAAAAALAKTFQGKSEQARSARFHQILAAAAFADRALEGLLSMADVLRGQGVQ